MKINHVRILTEVLDQFPVKIDRAGSKFRLVEDHGPEDEVHAEHEDWTKFVWLCGEWLKKQ